MATANEVNQATGQVDSQLQAYGAAWNKANQEYKAAQAAGDTAAAQAALNARQQAHADAESYRNSQGYASTNSNGTGYASTAQTAGAATLPSTQTQQTQGQTAGITTLPNTNVSNPTAGITTLPNTNVNGGQTLTQYTQKYDSAGTANTGAAQTAQAYNESDTNQNTGEEDAYLVQKGQEWNAYNQLYQQALATGNEQLAAQYLAARMQAHQDAENYRINTLGYSSSMNGTGYNPIAQQQQTAPQTGDAAQYYYQGGGSSGTTIQGTAPTVDSADTIRNQLLQANQGWLDAATQQAVNQVNYATQTGVEGYQRTLDEAEQTYQANMEQIAREEMNSLDNSALYAEARGDKGGIGQAQYNSIMNTAAINRQTVKTTQEQTSVDIQNEINDLRAQGEFEKADAVLDIAQQYYSNLLDIYEWAANYGLSVAQFNESIREWENQFLESIREYDQNFNLSVAQFNEGIREYEQNYNLNVAELLGNYNGMPTLAAQQLALSAQQYQDSVNQTQRETLATAGTQMLSAGILPSDEQLSAMGMTREQAQSYIAAVLAANSASSSAGSGGGGNPTPAADDYSQQSIYDAALASGWVVDDNDFANWLATEEQNGTYDLTQGTYNSLVNKWNAWYAAHNETEGTQAIYDNIISSGVRSKIKAGLSWSAIQDYVDTAMNKGAITRLQRDSILDAAQDVYNEFHS